MPAALEPQVTASLARYIASAQITHVGAEVRELGRLHVLDTLASIVACRDLEPARVARQLSLQLSGDARKSAATILGTYDRASIVDAVFASAMTGHGAEINDFNPSAFVQPGPAVVSTALALAETRHRSGDAVLRAVIAGYELAGRVPRALGVENLRRAGIANHAIGALFGAAATAASLLELPRERVGDLLALCAQQAGGSWQWLLDVEHIEKSFVFAGMGARNGLHAALMVEAGFRGVRDCLDQYGGFMAAPIFAGGDADRSQLIEGLHDRSELHLTAFKRHPVGGPAQPAVEALLDLLPRIERRPVERVRIAMPGRANVFRDAAMPALNLRYLAAIILLDGRLDFTSAQSLDRMRSDASVREAMAKIDVEHDPAQEAAPGTPRTESARVVVTLQGGVELEKYVPFVRGFPSHPMSRADVEHKALELMTPRLGARRAGDVVEKVSALEELPAAAELVSLIAWG
jgi:2-methylcitrate dehydratase PrpD